MLAASCATLAASCATAGPLSQLESAIAARLLLMDDVARYKWNHALPIVDAEREAAVIERSTTEAVALGLSESYARRVIAAQIEASRALQQELVMEWRREQHPQFANVPDLNAEQRPLIEAATRRLLERLNASGCALARADARPAMAMVPAPLATHGAAWTIAIEALWPAPDAAHQPVATADASARECAAGDLAHSGDLAH